MNNFKIFALFLPLSVPILCNAALAQKPTQKDYYVAYTKSEVNSKSSGEKFPMALVYPTETPSKPVKFGPFEMDLSIGGKIAEGKFPLVIISHGSGGTNLGHRSIAFALVRNGFVVGMPLHPNNNYQNNTAQGTIGNWKNRPLHISASIDALQFDHSLSESIDFENTAVIGHSAGGYTALAAAGGRADTTHIRELCLSNQLINEPYCGLAKENETKTVKIANSRDERIKAIVLMAPVGILFKSKGSLADVNIPMLLLKAEQDSELTEPYQSDVIAKNYNKDLLTYCTIKKAGHFSFITPFPEIMKNELGTAAEDPTGFDRNIFHETLSADIVAFLTSTLYAKDNNIPQLISCDDG